MLYDEILNNKEYLALVKQIESFKFITDGNMELVILKE